MKTWTRNRYHSSSFPWSSSQENFRNFGSLKPRYRQMLDTCILDERPFGLVMNDPFEPTNGWDGPRRHGCEAIILNHETRGVNHFITITGGRRFFVENVIEPALPPFF